MVTAEGRSAPEQAIEDWGRHWSSHDFDHLLPLFTDDVVYERVTMGLVHRGKGELRAFGEGLIAAFPDVTFELTSRHATGHRGGAEWVMRGTHRGDMPGLPATDRAVEVRGASIFEFADGQIRRCADYWDFATLLRQIGVLPADLVRSSQRPTA